MRIPRVPCTLAAVALLWSSTTAGALGSAGTAGGASASIAAGMADLSDSVFDAIDHPAIGYSTTAADDAVVRLIRRVNEGTIRLEHDTRLGFLPSLLRALEIPVESQIAVFSKTSLQQQIIGPDNPRAIFFNDEVAVAWPAGGFIEIAAQDARQGIHFYGVGRGQGDAPQVFTNRQCLTCHHAFATGGVPGMLIRSVAASTQGAALPSLANYVTDDRSPFDERWAGWFVTGNSGRTRHLGNVMSSPAAADPQPNVTSVPMITRALDNQPTRHSDIVALLVFNHQMRVMNLLTRVGWEVRLAAAEGRDADAVARAAARELVDALLFVNEARIEGPISGSSGFADAFTARGPADAKGRSLRQFDLRTRIMRYPCSYMIYSPAFDALPDLARQAVYERLWAMLSGAEPSGQRIPLTERRAIVEILLETKKGLPDYFRRAIASRFDNSRPPTANAQARHTEAPGT